MADQSDNVESTSPCRYLLSKSMYVNIGHPAGEHVYDNCWCNQTQTVYGPDAKLCGADECSESGRSCYEAP